MHDFCAAIQDGKPMNNAQESANSTLTGILGRMAAYEGRIVTWDEMMEKKTKDRGQPQLPPEGMEFKAITSGATDLWEEPNRACRYF